LLDTLVNVLIITSLYTSVSLLNLATSAALSMHNFHNGYILNIVSFILVVSSMSFWFRECAVLWLSCHERSSLYPCLYRIAVTGLGLWGKPKAEHSIPVETDTVGNPKLPIIDLW